jgi:DNA-binding NtrC family response regulator
MSGRILIVDDEKDMLTLLQRIIAEDSEHTVVTTSDPLQALAWFKEQPFDLVISDLKMPRMDGMQFFEALKEVDPDVAFVILTAYATIETAVDTIRKGAHDYITKPFRRERILLTVNKVMQWREIVQENRSLRQALGKQSALGQLVGTSPRIQAVRDRIRQVAPTSGTVLITGASGTGKELVARAIHEHSLRRQKKLVTINCTAIPENVIESELFGHVKGAFTGAWKDKRGLVEEAHEGTLFLDEIGDLSPLLQTKLLRLLQEGEYKPVGSVTTKRADLRFIAATNHDLRADIQAKRFREDLYYRLNVIHFEMPPLRERKEDIALLSHHFLRKYSQANQKKIREIAPAVLQALAARDFPGNVRELENLMERGVIFCNEEVLQVKDLSLDQEMGGDGGGFGGDFSQLSFREAKERTIQDFHIRYIQDLLRESGGNISRAAETAGIQRQYLHRLMKEVGIDADEFKSPG